MVAFRCYISEEGVDQVKAWFDAREPEVQADFLAVIEIMEATSRDRWSESYFKTLEKRRDSPDCEGLDEMILVVNRVHYRVFGFAGPREADFTMLLPIKKDDDPTYKTSCTEAKKRKAEVLNDWSRAREWEPPG